MPDASYTLGRMQRYFEYIIKKHETLTGDDKAPIQMLPNEGTNRIHFRIKQVYSIEFMSPEVMKFLGSAERKISENKDCENVPQVEITEFILVHCSLVNNEFQRESKILHTFVPNKPYGKLLEITPTNLIFSKTYRSEYSYIEVWFTDQNLNPLEIEDKINLTLVIK